MIDLPAIRERLAAADPGPYSIDRTKDGVELHVSRPMPGGGRGEGIARLYAWGPRLEANAQLLSNAPADLAALLDHAATLEARLREVEAERDQTHSDFQELRVATDSFVALCQEACGALFDAGREIEEARSARRPHGPNCATYSGRFQIAPFVFSEDDDD